MTQDIRVGPPQLTVHRGYTVMVTRPDGQITEEGPMGLYFLDTRLISVWALYANGEPWTLLNGGNIAAFAATVYATNQSVRTAGGPIPEKSVGLVFSRQIEGGMHEDLDVSNFGASTIEFNLELAIRSDFADIFEVKSETVIRRGQIASDWSAEEQVLTTSYVHADFSRALRLRVSCSQGKASYANGRLSLPIRLDTGETWHACLHYAFADGTEWSEPPTNCLSETDHASIAGDQARWGSSVLKVTSSNASFSAAFAQAVDDMAALRLPTEDSTQDKFVPAAGLPWFVALFGRDSLIISLQSAIVQPGFAAGALAVLAKWQARERDDYRDAEPGKIHHELRRGELAHFKLIPHTPYYGTADATPLYIITLHTLWTCTGDPNLLKQHLETAERCLAWIDSYGDRDGDGFQEYQTRSSAGYENQGWKDSGDAVMNVDGTLVKGPKALCELQGYVYDAWLRMALIYDALERPDAAAKLREKAAALFKRFNERFWNEAEGFYAFALDGDKKQVLSVASNPGQCLWSGIVPADRARRVVDRLMRPDMWSGWGIRTLSANHTKFNPFNYQTGAVWPHDNGFIAAGMKRYGFHDEANQVAEAIFRAASYFAMNQLPELYAGVKRDSSNFPVQYIGANVPQGWAAGSTFTLLQTMLGIQPDAANGVLYIDPSLPTWLPDVTLRDLKLGKQSFDIRFHREKDTTVWSVSRGPENCVIRRSIQACSEQLTRTRTA
jgi:glycogen debranching enzyme